MCLPTGALCCTWTCLSARIFAAPVRVCLQELCDAPGRVCQQECSPGCNCRCSVENLFVCFGLFRNSSDCFGCFDIGSKHRNKPKYFYFWFHEANRNKRETDLVSVCFGSNRNLFLFVSRTPYLQPPPFPCILAHIWGRYWSARIDDISLWPPVVSWSYLQVTG